MVVPINPQYSILALNGPLGGGKGTVLEKVVKPYAERQGLNLVTLPVSDELRLFLSERATDAGPIRADMKAGRLVQDSIVNQVFVRALERVEKPEGKTLFVIDGAPRTSGQIQTAILSPMQMLGVSPQNFTFAHLTTPDWLCGFRAALRKREDDTEEIFSVRWGEWESKTIPAIQTVVSNAGRFGIRVQEINGQFIIGSESLVETLLFGNGTH
jgi:adenylate kinase family enzyme